MTRGQEEVLVRRLRQHLMLLAVVGFVVLTAAGTAAHLAAGAARPQCLVADPGSGVCRDATLTAQAPARVIALDEEPADDGPPVWTVEFVASGTPVTARIVDWPAPSGTTATPAVGDTVTVAYAPEAPSRYVTPADALADVRAVARDDTGSRRPLVLDALGTLLTTSGLGLLVAGIVIRSRTRQAASRRVRL